MLDELDRELERRGLRFTRYADDCNIYVKSKRAGGRVMHSISCFITHKLKREGQHSEERSGESMGAAVSWLLFYRE